MHRQSIAQSRYNDAMRGQVIVAFGYHDQEAPRQWNIVRELQSQGCEVRECHTTARGFLGKVWDLHAQWKQKRTSADALLVTFPGHYLVPLAWMLTRMPRRRLIFDAFLSLSDSVVTDRGLVSWWNPYAWFLYAMDWLSCHLADEVLIDTDAHRRFFLRRFHLRPDRVRVVYLGSRTDLFQPKTKNQKLKAKSFDVFFYGTYIPLQGVEYILDAAKIVQSQNSTVHFTLVGRGQTYSAMRAKAEQLQLRNVTFLPFVLLAELPTLLKKADLCLGIFGTTAKAQHVIPHKVYDAVACGVPIITEDSPALRERFAATPSVIPCPAGDSAALARIILTRV